MNFQKQNIIKIIKIKNKRNQSISFYHLITKKYLLYNE